MRPERGSDLAPFGRFSEPAFLVLVSLANGPKHGYAMMDDIEAIAGTRLGAGTLYGAISRLETRRLIEPIEAEDRRRPYRLTVAGSRVLKARLSALQAVMRIGQRRLADA